MVKWIDIVETPVDFDHVRRVVTEASGAVSSFIGTVRNQTEGKEVLKLHYEAYRSMALKEMEKLVDRAVEKWPLNGVAIIHRTGDLFPGDVAVLIAVSTPHRADSFEACRFLIDTLKETVPIWKKEYFAEGEVWVSAHP